MFRLPILEVTIGLAFVYLLLALICTSLNDTIAGLIKRRAAFPEKGINSLLSGDPSNYAVRRKRDLALARRDLGLHAKGFRKSIRQLRRALSNL